MSFFELNDIKRDRIPYSSDVSWHLPFWSPLIENNIIMNMKRASVGAITGALIVNFILTKVEPLRHYWESMKTLNLAYEWPRNKAQWSIFLKESTKIPYFWSGLRKK